MHNRYADIIESTAKVASSARHLIIDQDAIRAFCSFESEESLATPAWDEAYHYAGDEHRTAAYLFVLASMNFASGKLDAWRYQSGDELLDGYFAVSTALRDALLQGIPLDDAAYLATISESDFDRIFNGNGVLPWKDKRLDILHEIGEGLDSDCGGSAYQLISDCESSAQKLLDKVLTTFPSFVDVASYFGQDVSFHKRAQILVGDLYGAFRGQGLGYFHDIETITAFADDSLPHALRHAGILRYTADLARKVDGQQWLPPGSEEEVEIRACTIQAVESVRNCLIDSGLKKLALEIDWIFWNRSTYQIPGERHRTNSIAY